MIRRWSNCVNRMATGVFHPTRICNRRLHKEMMHVDVHDIGRIPINISCRPTRDFRSGFHWSIRPCRIAPDGFPLVGRTTEDLPPVLDMARPTKRKTPPTKFPPRKQIFPPLVRRGSPHVTNLRRSLTNNISVCIVARRVI